MNPIIKRILRNRFFHLFVVLVIGFHIGLFYDRNKPVSIEVTVTSPRSTTVTVNVPVLTEKTITKVVKELQTPPEVVKKMQELLAENATLNVQVSALTDTVAELKTKGGGIVIVNPDKSVDFKDFRLNFHTDGKSANYTLTQKFRIIQTMGKNADGKPVALATGAEVTPTGLVPFTNVETVLIAAVPSPKRWFFSPTLQAGLGITKSVSLKDAKGAIVGVQLFKRGTSKAAEDSTLSVVTPVLFIAEGVTEPGILPVSFNLGSLKGNPLKDVWASPFVGVSPLTWSVSRVGFTISASF